MGLRDFLLGPPTYKGSTSIPVTASAVKVQAQKQSDERQALRRLIQPWQQAAFGYYDVLGECWYPAQFYGRALARLRLYVAEVKPDGEVEPFENAKADALLARVQDPGGGRSEILRTYGQLAFVTGESYLVCTEDDGGEAWEMLSVDELRVNPGAGYTRFRAPQLTPEQLADVPDDAYEPLPKSAVVYRFWNRHPRYSALADAPTKGVIQLYDLLTRLRAAELADSKSRAANAGILFLSEDIKFADPGVQDDDPNQDTFMRDLTAAIIAAIKDPSEAAAVAPMIARIPTELLKDDSWGHLLKLRDASDHSETSDLIDRVIRHIALGLDIPPEVMVGLEDTNHWNAWIVQDETWQSHLGPVAQRFCNDLTAAYFRPAAKQEKVEGWENLVIAYDATEVINHPDRGKDAQEAFDSGAIGFTAYRDARGFSDDDAPTDDELRLMIGWKAADVAAVTGDPKADTGTQQSDVATADQQDAGANAANEVQPGPPEEPVAEDAVAASIVAMAEMAVIRCRELAGSRLRTHARNCETCVEKLVDVEQDLVASVLGFDAAVELEAPTPSALIAGGARVFGQAVRSKGVSDDWADRLCELVELHAARTLYQAQPGVLPAGFMEAARRAL